MNLSEDRNGCSRLPGGKSAVKFVTSVKLTVTGLFAKLQFSRFATNTHNHFIASKRNTNTLR